MFQSRTRFGDFGLSTTRLLVQDEILDLKPRSPRKPRADNKQQLDQQSGHRLLLYNMTTNQSSRPRFSVGTGVWHRLLPKTAPSKPPAKRRTSEFYNL